MIMTILNKELSEKELSQIFNLLKHPLRRGILKQLSKSPQAYSQILKNLNIQESSILNYHLREMDDLLIKKDVNGKYKLNEVGEICLQLVLKVKEKENNYRLNKLQLMLLKLKSTIFMIQIAFLLLVTILVLELYFLNVIDLSSIVGIFASGAIFSTVLSAGNFIIFREFKSNFEKKDKLGTFSIIFTTWILIQTILKLLL